jgi:nicotinamide-nucleotide amidase
VTDPFLLAKTQILVSLLRERKLLVAAAESCTGGLVAAAITAIPGASDVFDRGFVTYSNAAKQEMLGVPAETIAEHGAVSEETVRAMALGALEHSCADIVVAVTGIAGPSGGTAEKPVGLVHFACARRGGETVHSEVRFVGPLPREAIRDLSAKHALEMLFDAARAR